MKYTVPKKCPNEKYNYEIKSVPIMPHPKTDMSWINPMIFRFRCPLCQTYFDIIAKEQGGRYVD